MSPEDRIKNSDAFYQRGLLLQHYFLKAPKTLDTKHHILVPWGPFVFASMAGMRVVVIQKVTHPEDGFDWTTMIFSGEDNVEPRREERIIRLSDDDFRRVPTIEIYYTGGEGIDNHVQFLHRIFRDDATGAFPEPDKTKLLDVLKRQYKVSQPESDKEALNELDAHVQQPDPVLNAENSQNDKKKQSQESRRKKQTVDNSEHPQEEEPESSEGSFKRT